jgi:hypothetical protein
MPDRRTDTSLHIAQVIGRYEGEKFFTLFSDSMDTAAIQGKIDLLNPEKPTAVDVPAYPVLNETTGPYHWRMFECAPTAVIALAREQAEQNKEPEVEVSVSASPGR